MTESVWPAVLPVASMLLLGGLLNALLAEPVGGMTAYFLRAFGFSDGFTNTFGDPKLIRLVGVCAIVIGVVLIGLAIVSWTWGTQTGHV